MTVTKKPGGLRASRSVECLRELDAIVLQLENGRSESFNIARELEIPSDPIALDRCAREAPAKLAFWSYQCSRLQRDVRRAEHAALHEESMAHLVQRKRIAAGDEPRYVANDHVLSAVRLTPTVVQKKKDLLSLQYDYDVVRAVRDAVAERCFVIRRLLSPTKGIEAN